MIFPLLSAYALTVSAFPLASDDSSNSVVAKRAPMTPNDYLNYEASFQGIPCSDFRGYRLNLVPQECIYDVICGKKFSGLHYPCDPVPEDLTPSALMDLHAGCRVKAICTREKSSQYLGPSWRFDEEEKDATDPGASTYPNVKASNDGQQCSTFKGQDLTQIPQECVYDVVCSGIVIDNKFPCPDECNNNISVQDLQALSPGCRYEAICAP